MLDAFTTTVAKVSRFLGLNRVFCNIVLTFRYHRASAAGLMLNDTLAIGRFMYGNERLSKYFSSYDPFKRETIGNDI